jgi:hypothetical protein
MELEKDKLSFKKGFLETYKRLFDKLSDRYCSDKLHFK